MGMTNRAVQNAFMRLQEVIDLQPPIESNRETSQYKVSTDDRPGDTKQQQHAIVAHEDTAEVTRDSPPTSSSNNNNNNKAGMEETKQEVNRRSRGRLSELEQQLEMAETRCGTLKQQLDYMRILYQGVDRSRTLSDVPGLEAAEDEAPVKAKKEKHHHHHKRRSAMEGGGGVEGVCISQSASAASEKKRGGGRHDSVSLSAVQSCRTTSSHRESAMTDLTKLAKPEPLPIRDLIDFGDQPPPAEEGETDGGQEAAQVIQDILCGISHTVNRASGRGEEQPQYHQFQEAGDEKARKRRESSHTLVDLGDACDKDEEVTREAVSMLEIRPRVTGPKAEDFYSGSFQRVYANDSLTRKSAKTGHSPRRDHPYGLSTVGRDAESDDSLRAVGTKRKKGAATKRTSDKKARANVPRHLAGAAGGGGKANDDTSTVTAARPKKKKLMKTRNAQSRSTLKSHRYKSATMSAKTPEDIPAYSSEQIPYDSWHNNNNNLVEIYHNTALRTETSVSEEHIKGVTVDSDTHSMMSYLKKTREEPNIPSRLGVSRPATGSALRVDDAWERRSNSPSSRLHHRGLELPTTDSAVGPLNRDSSKMSHFELPTVSSRMKQVDRSYLQRFNFRTIPFVVGKSTTPTHNLGLNIQQVLSMIKMRQPVTGLSPMALAGGLLRESQMPSIGGGQGPITSYLERMSSRPTTTRSRGLALPPTILEHDEMELPRHDDDDEGCPDFEVHRGAYQGSRTMTTADMGLKRETNNHDEFETYRADWGSKRSESTTFPGKKNNNYHKVLNQYLGGEQLSFLGGRRGHPRGKMSRRGEGEEFNKTLHHQMKGMKEVMQKLHDDFLHLSQDYEELCATVERDDAGMLIRDEDHETLREMAAAVQSKENEIKLVMELLEEVSTLHKMVASLNQKTSIASMTRRLGPSAPRQKQCRIIPREPTTSVRLTRLLRTIQSFQEKLKQEK